MIEPLRSNEKKSGNKFNQSGEKCGTHNTRKPTRQNNTNIMPENLTNLVFCMSYLQKSKYIKVHKKFRKKIQQKPGGKV